MISDVPCDRCGAQVPADEARCPACGTFVAPPHPKADAEPPPGLEVRQVGDGLSLIQPWRSWRGMLLMGFAVLWNAFVLLWYIIAMTRGAWEMMLIGVLYVAAGILLAYVGLAGVLNRTIIRLRSGELEVRHGPLPWPGEHHVPIAALDQLFCGERSTKDEDGAVRTTFALIARLVDGPEIVLLKGMESADEVRAMEVRIERALGIEDRPVPGEHRG